MEGDVPVVHGLGHARKDRLLIAVLAAAALGTAVVVAPAGALGVNPAAGLASTLKAKMQAHYAGSGVRITTVTCRIAKSGTSALCQAHFAVVKERAVGIFTVAATIDPATGGVETKTTKTVCSDSKTGAKLRCF